MFDFIRNASESSTFKMLFSAAALAALCGVAYAYVSQPSGPATNLKIRLFEFERTVPTPPTALAATPPAPTTTATVDPCLPIIGGGCFPQPITTATYSPTPPAPAPMTPAPMTNTVTVIVGAPTTAANVSPTTSLTPAPKPTITPPNPAPGPKPVATSEDDGAICAPRHEKTASR